VGKKSAETAKNDFVVKTYSLVNKKLTGVGNRYGNDNGRSTSFKHAITEINISMIRNRTNAVVKHVLELGD
jgi:hypothetical protein